MHSHESYKNLLKNMIIKCKIKITTRCPDVTGIPVRILPELMSGCLRIHCPDKPEYAKIKGVSNMYIRDKNFK
jgi:hypothetical protein